MHLAIDIGATKTLLAHFDDAGQLLKKQRFLTNHSYPDFIRELGEQVHAFGLEGIADACVACPARLNRTRDVAIAFGSIDWRDVPMKQDIEAAIGMPILFENDVKLAALSEAREPECRQYHKVLYLTISTGISDGMVAGGHIDPELADSEAGQMMLEHEGVVQKWESFASGSAIVKKYGKIASKIDDPAIWLAISNNIALGLINVIADIQPDVVVIGGGVGTNFAKFGEPLTARLHELATPLVTVPPIIQAKRPEEAVIYGCYEFLTNA